VTIPIKLSLQATLTFHLYKLFLFFRKLCLKKKTKNTQTFNKEAPIPPLSGSVV